MGVDVSLPCDSLFCCSDDVVLSSEVYKSLLIDAVEEVSISPFVGAFF